MNKKLLFLFAAFIALTVKAQNFEPRWESIINDDHRIKSTSTNGVAQLTGNIFSKSVENSRSETALYYEGFEDAEVPGLPEGWTVLHTGTTKSWVSAGKDFIYGTGNVEGMVGLITPYAGDQMLSISWVYTGRNAWAISPAINLTAGVRYSISFWVKMPGYQGAYNGLECRVGRTPTQTGMNGGTVIYSKLPIAPDISTWTQVTGLFTATATGIHHIGFNDITQNAQTGSYIIIDDISVELAAANDLQIIAVNPLLAPQVPKCQAAGFSTGNPFPTPLTATAFNGGYQAQTNVRFSATLNGTNLGTSASIATLPSGETSTPMTFTPTTGTVYPSTPGNNNLIYTVSQNETEANPDDNSITFTQQIGDVYAFDNVTVSNNGVGFDGTGSLGNIYTIYSKTFLTAVTVAHNATTALNYSISLHQMTGDETCNPTPIFTIPIARSNGFSTIQVPVTELNPGKYFICIDQLTTTSVALCYDSRANSQRIYTKDLTGTEVGAVNGFGAAVIRMVVKENIAKDVQIKGILTPAAGSYQTMTDNEPVKISLANNSATSISNFQLLVEVNDEVKINETYTGTLQSMQTVEYTFNGTLNLYAQGTYNIKVTAIIENDEIPENNSKTIAVTNMYCHTITEYPWIENFESSTFPPNCWLRSSSVTTQWTRANTTPMTDGYKAQRLSATGSNQQSWLITKAFKIPEEGAPILSFLSYTDRPLAYTGGSSGDSYQGVNRVWISNTTQEVSAFTQLHTLRWQEDVPNTAAWRNLTLDLTPYKGQTVYFGFVYSVVSALATAHSWHIDNVEITDVSDTPLDETFNGDMFPPKYWQHRIVSGNANTLAQSSWHRLSTTPVHDGAYATCIAKYETPSDPKEYWLITKPFKVAPGSVSMLEFMSYITNATYYTGGTGAGADGLSKVLISTKGSAQDKFEELYTLRLGTDFTTSAAWNKMAIDISDYVGDVYVAFVYSSTNSSSGGHTWRIDNVKAIDYTNYIDASITAILAPPKNMPNYGTWAYDNTFVNMTDSEELIVTIKNFGGAPISGFNLKVEVNGVEAFTEIYSGEPIPFQTEKDYIFTQKLDLTAEGQYIIKVSIEVPGDELASNNSQTRTFTNILCNGITTLPLEESFDNEKFPPNCWSSFANPPTVFWRRAQSNDGLTPTSFIPHSGVASLRFFSQSNAAGSRAWIVTPEIEIADRTLRFSFWMYRDAGRPDILDRVNVYICETREIADATLLGTFHRSTTQTPAIATGEGWYQYYLNFPLSFTNKAHIIIEAVAGGVGYNMHIDDLAVFEMLPDNIAVTPVVYPYAQVPVSQTLIAPLSAKIENIGINAQSLVRLNVVYNGGATATSANVPSLNPNSSEIFTASPSNTAVLLGENSIIFTAVQDQIDNEPANNTAKETFTGTKNRFAADDGTPYRNLGASAAGASYGNVFTVTQSTKLNAVELNFAAATVPIDFSISLYEMPTDNTIAATPEFTKIATRPAEAGWMVIMVDETVLTPGKYFLCATQTTTTNFQLLADGNNKRAGAGITAAGVFNPLINSMFSGTIVGAPHIRMLVDLPNNDLILIAENPALPYTKIPAEQAAGLNMTFPTSISVKAFNLGMVDQNNVVFSAYFNNRVIGSTTPVTVAPGESKVLTLPVPGGFTYPVERGNYDFIYMLSQTETDENPTDNNATFTFEIGDKYALDDITVCTNGENMGTGYRYGNIFKITKATRLVAFELGHATDVPVTYYLDLYKMTGPLDTEEEPILSIPIIRKGGFNTIEAPHTVLEPGDYFVCIYVRINISPRLSFDTRPGAQRLYLRTYNGTTLTPQATYGAGAIRMIMDDLPEYTLTVKANPTTGGQVYMNRVNGIYFEGAIATVTAIPDDVNGYEFISWVNQTSGSVVSNDAIYSFPVMEDTDLIANFALKKYNVSVISNDITWGTVSGGNPAIDWGSEITVTATTTNDLAYEFVNWSVENGEVVSNDAEYTFEVYKDVNLVATFKMSNTYIVSINVLPSGSGSISGNQPFYYLNETVTLTPVPTDAYYFVNWTRGTETVTDNPLIFNITNDVELTANFAMKQFTITASVDGSNGVIVPPGVTTLYYGGNQEYLIVPFGSHRIAEVLVDGVPNEEALSGVYGFTDVKVNHTIVAKFAVNQHIVTFAAPENGTLVVKAGETVITSGTPVDHGTELTITATPANNYHLVSIAVNGTTQPGNTYTVASATLIAATFAKDRFEITYDNPENGTLSVRAGYTTIPSGTMVDHGTELTIEANPSEGYHLSDIKVNGSTLQGNTYTVISTTAIVASFAINQYIVTYSAPQNGTINVMAGSTNVISGTSVNHGTVITISPIPDDGYRFVAITINGNTLTGNTYTVTSAITIEAIFEMIPLYNVTVVAEGEGTVEIVGHTGTTAAIAEGTFVTVRATAETEWLFQNWTDDGGNISYSVEYIFEVVKDVVLTAHFTEVGIIENIMSNIVLYPNPFKNEINISNPSVVKSVQMTNVAGQKVKEITFNGNFISTGELANGIYFIVIESVTGDKAVYKMIKN